MINWLELLVTYFLLKCYLKPVIFKKDVEDINEKK